MTVPSIRRRFPKALSDQLSAAFAAVSHLKIEEWEEYLARYRRNRIRRIAAWGTRSIGAPVGSLEHIPFEHIEAVKKIDAALAALHRCRAPGGEEDYLSDAVFKLAKSYRARQIAKKPRKADEKEIASFLIKRAYSQLGNGEKKMVRQEAQSKFGISDSTVNRAINSSGLGRKKKLSLAS